MFYVAVTERISDASARGLAEAVSRAVGDGALPGGTRIPPVRAVAATLRLSPSTVNAAWQLLRRAGTIRTDGRRGTVVATPGGAGRYRSAMPRSGGFALDLSTGVPDPSLLPPLPPLPAVTPTAVLPGAAPPGALSHAAGLSPAVSPGAAPPGALSPAALLPSAASSPAVLPGSALSPSPSSYLDAPVLPALASLLRSQWPYPAERLAIFDGAMDAIDHVASAILRLGDLVLVENPCFPPLLDLLEALGARVTGVPTDESGMLPGPLAEALTRRPAAVFVQPRSLNPTGASWSPSRSTALAAVLSRSPSLYVVEDDSAGDLSSGPPLSIGTHLPRNTVHVRSFSKSHGPDLRLAAISGPATLLDPILERRLLGQGWTSRLLQHLLLTLLTDPSSTAAVTAARDEYARRRRLITSGLAAAGIVLPPGEGLNIWLPVADEQAALLSLASNGIGAAAGSAFTVGPNTPPHIRVTVGLIAEDHATVADHLARAARAATPPIPR